jgi:hypothetical protein
MRKRRALMLAAGAGRMLQDPFLRAAARSTARDRGALAQTLHSWSRDRAHETEDPLAALRVRDFLVHLRLHYQLLILAAPYLCGGMLAPTVAWTPFCVQFLNVHVLLFGGATAFNSFWDKDEGPIGGLRHPPRMLPWMRVASLALLGVGFCVAAPMGVGFATIYALAALLFWLYSTPLARWKGRPLLSFVAIGASTGSASLLMGRLAAAPAPLGPADLLAAAAVAATLLSLYPVSQIYQIAADRDRGDRTFASVFGLRGVRIAFFACFVPGVALLGAAMRLAGMTRLPVALALAGVLLTVAIGLVLSRLRGRPSEYERVMRVKYATSAAFVALLVVAMVLKDRGVML